MSCLLTILKKQENISINMRNNDIERRQTSDKLNAIKQEKSILELGNESTGEKGLLQINKEIEKNKLERKSLEQSFIVKSFWSPATILISFFFI